MTRLRQRMLDELQRCNYSPHTVRSVEIPGELLHRVHVGAGVALIGVLSFLGTYPVISCCI